MRRIEGIREKFRTLFIAAAMLISVSGNALGVDFRISGEWLSGFGAGTGSLYSHFRGSRTAPKVKVNSNDIFEANQRARLQLDAVASEALSGTVGIEIGDQSWGMADQGMPWVRTVQGSSN